MAAVIVPRNDEIFKIRGAGVAAGRDLQAGIAPCADDGERQAERGDIQNAVEGPTYRERLEADPEAKLTKETLDEIFDPWDFLTRKDEVFKRLESLEF